MYAEELNSTTSSVTLQSTDRHGILGEKSTELERAVAWEQEGYASGERREIIGAVDETFLERMILVCMDLATGYLLVEEVADDRTYPTWKAMVEERLNGLGTGVWYMVSDRAQALIQLAEQGLGMSEQAGFLPCHP